MTTQGNRGNKIIEKLLNTAGWSVQDHDHSDPHASSGVALRDFPLARGYGVADYLIYVEGKASGIIEVQARGSTLTGIEMGAEKYRRGLPFTLPLYTRPLPFLYVSNGVETRFTNGFDPEPRARNIFAFHKPETLKEWIEEGLVGGQSKDMAAEAFPEYGMRGMTLLHRLWINMPPLPKAGLTPNQSQVIQGLETSLRRNNARALISMESRSNHLPTAVHLIYRLLKFAGARRVLYLFDNDDLKHQALDAFQRDVSDDHHPKFTETFFAEILNDKGINAAPKVCISTPTQIIDLLQEKERTDKKAEEPKNAQKFYPKPTPIKYNPEIPIETFDFIFMDESLQSNGSALQQIASYFDAYLIGFSSAPDRKTRHFFHQNLVMEYGSKAAGSNYINVSFDL